jgi:hypothetical protein
VLELEEIQNLSSYDFSVENIPDTIHFKVKNSGLINQNLMHLFGKEDLIQDVITELLRVCNYYSANTSCRL